MITTICEDATIVVDDIGVTLRTLLAVAAEGYKTNPKRVWKVSYANVVIGSVRIRTLPKKVAVN